MFNNLYTRVKQAHKIYLKDKTLSVDVYPFTEIEDQFNASLDDEDKFGFLVMTHDEREIIMKDRLSLSDENLIYSNAIRRYQINL